MFSGGNKLTLTNLRKLMDSRAVVLLSARACEQGLMMIMLVVLARRLGPTDFSPISILFVVNSLSLTASDFGLGVDLLRLRPDRSMAIDDLRRLRLTNSIIAVVAGLVGLTLGGSTGWLVAFGGLIWLGSAEAYVRAAGALRRSRVKATAAADVAGAAVAASLVLSLAYGTEAVVVCGIALVCRHLTAAMCIRDWREDFSQSGDKARSLSTWLTQLLAFATANVDYLLGGLLLGPEFLSVYLVSFRIANAVPSQVGAVVSRVALADLAAGSPSDRSASYRHISARVAVVGVITALLTIGAAPLIPLILGSRWREVAVVTVILAAAVPFRLLMGVAGSLALAANRVRHLARVELWRLAATAGLLLMGGLLSEPAFAVGASLAAIWSALALHWALAESAGAKRLTWMLPAVMLGSIVAVLFGMLV